MFEVTAPFLLWLPGTRWLVAVQSVLFHGGIGVLMGLVIFALEATMFQLIVFPDSSYRRLAARLPATPCSRRRRGKARRAGLSGQDCQSPKGGVRAGGVYNFRRSLEK